MFLGEETKCQPKKTQTLFVPPKPENVLTEGQQKRKHERELFLGFAFGLLQVLIRDERDINKKGAEDWTRGHTRQKDLSRVIELKLTALGWHAVFIKSAPSARSLHPLCHSWIKVV